MQTLSYSKILTSCKSLPCIYRNSPLKKINPSFRTNSKINKLNLYFLFSQNVWRLTNPRLHTPTSQRLEILSSKAHFSNLGLSDTYEYPAQCFVKTTLGTTSHSPMHRMAACPYISYNYSTKNVKKNWSRNEVEALTWVEQSTPDKRKIPIYN